MKSIRRSLAVLGLVAMVGGAGTFAAPATAYADQPGFDDRYIFAATRGVNDMDAHPAWKVPLFPVTVAVDAAFLPFAVIAGYVA
jgi:hypothetical protein